MDEKIPNKKYDISVEISCNGCNTPLVTYSEMTGTVQTQEYKKFGPMYFCSECQKKLPKIY